ncbi:MAG: orotidine-5'-phosphate decarboxylase, partial [Candidatus Omnitrophica bacterium]|nr:orotidine-5'-phosphate decarboxylase [Candidatus Omnitrophota bacterium]
MPNAGDKIIVALDTPSLDVAEKIIRDLEGLVSFYKVGFELFTAHGLDAVELVKKHGNKVFVDLKLHDIPNTVSQTMAVLCEHEIDMVTLHAHGGLEMMRKAAQTADGRVKTGKHRPKMVGVTVLTSHSEEELRQELGISRTLNDQVVSLAQLAQKAGLDGVVSSPLETAMLRKALPKDFLIITPGVRPEDSEKSDQKRVFTPLQAVQAGADCMVIG